MDMLEVNIQYCIKERYDNISVVHMVNCFTGNGTPIKKRMLLIIDVVNTEFLVFGKVEICLLLNSNPSFVCKISNSYRSELGLYKMDSDNVAKFRLVLSKELPNPFPLNLFIIGETKLAALKGYPFDQMIHC
ncbi:hypothetical protein SNE40_020606 [Patella caerulea]|uniref:Uncharacterized protein n=1 Tax=Patella caerulea TaxID=87958 RepID=A0AAN8J4R3_PATCE